MTDSKMYHDDLIRFIDRCGGNVIDKETNEKLDIVTVRATFNEVRDFDMPSNVEVMFGQNHVRFDLHGTSPCSAPCRRESQTRSVDYSLPEL